MAALFLLSAFYGILNGSWRYAVFLLLQGVTFTIFGLSCCVDTQARTCM